MCLLALVEVRGRNPRRFVRWAQRCICQSGSATLCDLGKTRITHFSHIVFKEGTSMCNFSFLQCTGVIIKQDPPTYWCCLVTETEIQYRKHGDMVLYYKNDIPVKCQAGWAGRNCDPCALNFGPPEQCNQCLRGFVGENCDECATNFGPPGNCERCVIGWTGDNYDSCATRWMGENCITCSLNFEPDGRCDLCLLGWGGDSCDVCEFGFSTESNCTECIQNGYWTGTYSHARSPLRSYLTFSGPACTNLVPGMCE